MTLLFAKNADGMLHQVPPELEEASRAGRRFRHVVLSGIDVLFTAEEEAQRDAEEEAARLAAEEHELALREEAKKIQQAREQAFRKLEKLGLSPDDIAAIMKP
jgi:DNA-directed RNA polymerase specialized sigma24 family protein